MADFSTTNVAATVGQGQQTNPIDTIQKFAFIQNLMNQNRLFQAQRAVGQAAQGAIDPATGLFNPNLANQAIAGNPAAAVAAPEALAQNLTYGINAQGLATKRYGNIATVMGSVPKGSGPGDYMAALNMGVQNGLYTGDDAANFVGGNVPSLNRWQQLATQAAVASGSTSEAEAQGGVITNIPTNAAVNPEVQNRFAPEGATTTPAGTPIPMGLAPQVANTPAYTRYNPVTRQTEVVTQAQAAASPPTGPIGAAPPLGTPEAVAGAAAANTAQAMAMQGAALEVPTRKATLSNLQGLATQFAAGPQSPFWKGVGSLAAEYGIPVPNANLATNATSAQEEFDKLSVGVLGAQRVAAGLPQTDASTALASGATPNERMTPKGIQRVLGVMQGNEDYLAAQNSAYQKWLSAGNTGESFGQFKNQFNRMFDPRVFQAQYATPDEKSAIMKSVGPKTFETQWTALHRLGWLGSPSGQ